MIKQNAIYDLEKKNGNKYCWQNDDAPSTFYS